ncbi:HD domain-containing phosphohydrolase [Acetobacterium sp.]|uniref:HD domain-containing phosphohydrolase n=1 Tax=Acetobacterium sp. TaxID=1872094 RepID=UPI00271BDBE8|nr:HD domain-containing phosphohydrolase [Acetobacterium sp.]MDO9492727.1 diguanylate cyclase [Acetobacterium sp.]
METVAASSLLIVGLVIAVGILLTLLVQSNKKLQKNNEETKSIKDICNTFIDSYETVVYLKDEQLNYRFINKAAEPYYHKSVTEIIAQDDQRLDTEAFGPAIIETDQQVIESGKTTEYEEKHKNRIYKIKKFPVKIRENRIGVGAFIREITDEEKLIKKQERVLFRNKILVNVLSKNFRNDKKQLDYVLHEALKLTDSSIGYICFYDEKKQQFTLNAWSKGLIKGAEIVEPKLTYPLEEAGSWGEAVRFRKPVILNNDGTKPSSEQELPGGQKVSGNFIAIPIFIDERIKAVVGFAGKEDHYSDNDVYEITVLMNGVLTNVERRIIQKKLFEERSKYFQTLISIGDGVMVVDPAGKIEMLNKVAQNLTGWTNEEAKGKHYTKVFVLSHEDQRQEIQDPIEMAMATDQTQELKNHAVLTAKDGSLFHLEDSAAPIKNEKGETIGIVLVFRDVSEKKQQREKIEYLSFHDALTGLYNRRFLEAELLRLDTERNLPISIIMGDVNGLKLTNDIFGHAHGDIFLKKIADVMRKICRADDIIARWGGDEFVILLPKTTIEQAKQIKKRIKTEFARDGVKVIKGNISLGCDVKTAMEQSIVECLESAEEKMYAVKILERDDFKSTTLDSIITTLQSDSPQEEEHALRVSQWCHDLGVTMELPHVKIKRLKLAGYFHDIGKIVLHKDLLVENSDHSEEELTEIKKHPIMGYRILNAFDDTMSLADAVLHHHERWDGSGYPKGLKGEEIPFLARVVAVVSCYDRLTSAEEGEKLGSNQNPLIHLEKMEGQFDPEIKREFINMIKNLPS